MKSLYLLLTIVKRSDAKEYESFFASHGINVTYNTPCNGTTHEKTLSLFGIEKTEKSMLMSLVAEGALKKVLKGLQAEMKIDLPDRGISVAVPLSGIGGAKALEYFSAEQPENETAVEEVRKMQAEKELIVAICEKGYTDLVMDAARAAGAAGGTTIRAKGTGAGAEKFFGISLAAEKEMVFIVSENEKKKEIMKAIMQNAGMETKAHALVFSLPVSDTAGFRFTDTVEKD